MAITFELPDHIEKTLKSMGQDPAVLARQSVLLDLYRQDILSHKELADVLGLSRSETEVLVERKADSLAITNETVKRSFSGTLQPLETPGDRIHILSPSVYRIRARHWHLTRRAFRFMH